MEVLSIIDVNKPDKVKDAINELIEYKNTAQELPNITKATIGLENVDNTADQNKPISSLQKQYIDNQNAQNIKLTSEEKQVIDSDIEINESKALLARRSDGTTQNIAAIKNEEGYEFLCLGAKNVPLRIQHGTVDINDVIVSRNPKITITNADQTTREDGLALISDLESIRTELEDNIESANNQKIDRMVLTDAEVANGIVSQVEGESFTDSNTDEMAIVIKHRSILNGTLLSTQNIPLKVATTSSRGLMSKEQVATLNDLLSRVSAHEGQNARFLYTANQNPTATQIASFVISKGKQVPFSGVAVVVKGTYHVWHYYENDNIGWRDDGVDTVSKATNEALGIVKGENTDGKIYIETNGTMSLVGYDDLVNRLLSLENTMIDNIAITGGSNNGTIKLSLTINGTTTTIDNISVTGLGSAAYHSHTDYASAEHTHGNYITEHQDITSKENKSNKVSNLTDQTSTTLYPSNKAVVDYVKNALGNNRQGVYYGEIATTEWVAENGKYYYILSYSMYNLKNAFVVGMTIETSQGFEKSDFAYRILPNNNIQFIADNPVHAKFKVDGEYL